MHKLNWNDLQYILAVANHGSLAAAARSLGVNHSTVLRRVNAFEELHAVRLFERHRSGYSLTPEGMQLLSAARSVEDVVTVLERRIDGKELKLEGRVRLTTTDSLLYSVIGSHIAAFHALYPAITIEVSVTNNVLNLTKRDADVAIRPVKDKPDPLVGKKVGEINFGLYASPNYWDKNHDIPMADQDWVGPDDVMANTTPGRWMRETMPNAHLTFTADTFVALGNAAELGLGVAMLPCCFGDKSSNLIRVGREILQCSNSIWILTHKDLLKSARIRTFMEYMTEAMESERSAFLGLNTVTNLLSATGSG